MIDILIVDDHKMLREALIDLLQPEPDFQVIGEAGNAEQAFKLAEKLSPDVILMDINLGEIDGMSVTRRILSKHPHIKVIGLSMHNEKSIIDAMYQAGAIAYLTKSAPSEEIIASVRGCMT
jgi:DNA-binding NarL/FixJ family response regulator